MRKTAILSEQKFYINKTNTEKMTEKEEAGKEYYVREEEIGTYVTETKTQQCFFRIGVKEVNGFG